MSKYKVGDKVRIRWDIQPGDYNGCSCVRAMCDHAGEVVTVREIVTSLHGDRFRIKEQLTDCAMFWHWQDDMVEPCGGEQKVFTKKDLKNGDVIVRRNGGAEIVIVDLAVCVTKSGGWNNFNDIHDDLTDTNITGNQWDIMKVFRPIANHHCQFFNNAYEKGELVYDRERDTKHLYNGKVICIENHAANSNNYTVGKIYQFVDGKLTTDHGGQLPHFSKIYSFKDWEDYSNSKFLEVKE